MRRAILWGLCCAILVATTEGRLTKEEKRAALVLRVVQLENAYKNLTINFPIDKDIMKVRQDKVIALKADLETMNSEIADLKSKINENSACCGPPKDACSDEPCLNDNECIVVDEETYMCDCKPGYVGNDCETEVFCSPSKSCQNRGECVETDYGSYCECREGYNGSYCQIRDSCFWKPCKNGATCVLTPGGKYKYRCDCTPEYITARCLLRDPCLDSPCQNNATCKTLRNTNYHPDYVPLHYFYECACLPGFRGTNCEVSDPCSASPCQNDGTCYVDKNNGEYSCVCTSRYVGKNCERNPYCLDKPCVGGRCTNTESSHPIFDWSNGNFQFTKKIYGYECQCYAGFSGTDCEIKDHCHFKPCVNGGTCSKEGNSSYSCDCPGNYVGKNCQFEDPCLEYPCKNGGSCNLIDDIDDITTEGVLGGSIVIYSCECPLGYTGDKCENEDPCVDSPCVNGGTCNAGGNGYTCECPSGYIGNNCESEDPCTISPCLNGGACNAVGSSSYTCECVPGYVGDNCETSDPCSASPCLNGGSCANVGDDYTCACPGGFIDKNCETQDLCYMNPCFNEGVCAMDNDSYTCTCPEGFLGKNCETKDPCFVTPCINGGTCTINVTLATSFICTCPEGWIGENCEKSDTEGGCPYPPRRFRADTTCSVSRWFANVKLECNTYCVNDTASGSGTEELCEAGCQEYMKEGVSPSCQWDLFNKKKYTLYQNCFA